MISKQFHELTPNTPNGSDYPNCDFCLDDTHATMRLACSHSVCNVCLESTNSSDLCMNCPLCMNDSINVSSLYDLSFAGDPRSRISPEKLVELDERQLGSVIESNNGQSHRTGSGEKVSPYSSVGAGDNKNNSSSRSRHSPPSASGNNGHQSGLESCSPTSTSSICTSCEEGVPAFAECKDCDQVMCVNCTSARQRLK